MSRKLPARPNLEYLKNEAKDLLAELRRSNPNAQLADAQFALSRDYGFDSWPKLTRHVESVRIAHPIAGGWIADVSNSTRHPANLFRSARIYFAVHENRVDIVDEFVDESGKPVRGRNHLDVDGVERDAGNGYSVSAVWRNQGIETVAKKGGRTIGQTTYVVSSDGRSLTVTSVPGESRIVLHRLIQ